MSKYIYKYVSPGDIEKVLGSQSQVTLKCSYPKDFNDPYELFLTIDFRDRPEVLAFYSEVVGDIPQLPTTCFSRSPSVVPMWAHYAQNLQGFAIEFDETLLAKSFPNSGFGDIDYRDSHDEDLVDMLYRAYEIGKPRYLYFLTKGVFSAAYYTKATCWSYEQERRMIARKDEVRVTEGQLHLLDVPNECVTALLCGPRASPETIRAVHDKANQIGCQYYELQIGKSSPTPYFVGSDGNVSRFNGSEIERLSQVCSSCNEPLENEAEQCSWCQIDDAHTRDAAARNIYRAFAHYGMLDDYIAGMEDISRGSRKA